MIEDFPKWQQFQNQSATKTQTSLKQLQKIYYKSHNKKKELQQISHFNKKCVKNEQQQQQPGLFDTQNLLNQAQVSFKTVEKIYTQISCVCHALCVTFIILLKWHMVLKIISFLGQVLLIVTNYYHYKYKKQSESIFDTIKCLNNRSKYILFQICIIVFADLILMAIVGEPIYRYFMGVLIIGDFILLHKLRRLYRVQKHMDMRIQESQFQSFEDQFKNVN